MNTNQDSKMQGPFTWILDQDLESEAKRAFKVLYIYIYIRRPLLARGHQAAKEGFSTLNPQFLSIFHQQVRYLLFDVLQVSNLVVYCTPWINNLPSTRSVVSTWGGPENQ